MKKYEKSGDLEAALKKKNQHVVRLCPKDHPTRTATLGNLAVIMGKRYRKLEDLGDLEVALQNFQEAAHLSPKGHSQRATYLRNISFTYKVRYEKLGDLQDLEDAIENLQKFIDLTPEELPERAGQLTKLASWRSLAQVKRIRSLSSFGVSSTNQYEQSWNLLDLEAVLQNFQEAAYLSPKEPLERVANLGNLAVVYEKP